MLELLAKHNADFLQKNKKQETVFDILKGDESL
jgi:hypothetical protein